MKILYIQDWFAFGGINRVTSCKENYLISKGFEVHNLCMDDRPNAISDYFYDPEIIMHSLYKDDFDQYLKIPLLGRIIRFILFRYKFISVIKSIKPDLIVTVRDYIEPLTVILFTRKIPRILEFHCVLLDRISPIYSFREWCRLNFKYPFYTLVSLTQRDREKREKILRQPIYVIPNPIYLKSECSNLEDKIVISLGRFHPQKGYDLLIPAWIKVAKKHPDWQLYIYGKGDEKEKYRRLIQQNNLSDQVFLKDPVENVSEVLLKSSIYVMSSRYEGFGLVLSEAMQCGVPCVSVDCEAGPSEIIKDGIDGFVVPTLDMDLLTDRICKLIQDDELRKKMGRNASFNIQRYKIDDVMKTWIDLFNKEVHSSQL
ncbi:MAG: glycosyltransferase family 4 protein [Bacteroidales bacterium]